jgi:hypothetical protein
MAKEKLEARFEKPPVRFSKSGIPYTLVDEIFHSERGQQIISRMATLRARDLKTGRFNPVAADDE